MNMKSLAKHIKNKSRNRAKIIAKKTFNKSFSFYSKPYINLDSDNNEIKINFKKNLFNPNFFIEIKHRKTGKRLERKIESNQVIFSLNELIEMEDCGIFDFYISIKGKLCHKKRIMYSHNNQFFKVVSKEKSRVLKAYSTKHGNLSLELKKYIFDCNISNLEVNNDKVLIKGNLEILTNDIDNVSKVLLIGRNRLDNNNNSFDMNFDCLGDGCFCFDGFLDGVRFFEDRVLNLRLDFYIRVYDGDVYYESLIDLSNFKSFENDEDRFLIKLFSGGNVFSYYATENKYSFALWVTTESAWSKSYTIAKGRSIYNRALGESLDENLVFFESFFGKSYSGNPKYIYEAMLDMGLDKKYTFVWAYSGEDKGVIPGDPVIVDRFEAGDYYKYLAKAKYWVNNIIFPIHTKRQGNVYLQTWHGTPLKKLGFDISIPGPEVEGRQNFYSESRNWDYLISVYDDIQELYVISDILITDYSSVFFDYAHSKRPILFFVPDLNHYVENVRGLYLNMEKELPGPLIKNNDELVNAIRNIDDVVNEYEIKYDEFYKRFCSLCKGKSAKKIIKKIF
ncbi:CDP-glycerol glycerophosphotransferase family protein [Methanobrevibacter oralis]|uniref:CDP-glycerol glycerophosphotransferase family protein n=1 Tax=Methanobrevibacter oralis TaxID=66851 RepID=UPI001C72BCDE|nr:CDP-glycerol glycerophosphotransferase family protein [Methanobrevibacter oralis]